MSSWDVPSDILTDCGTEFIGAWWKDMCTYLGVHHLKARVSDRRALSAERAGRIVLNILRKCMTRDKHYTWLELVHDLLGKYHQTPNYTRLSPNEVVFGRRSVIYQGNSMSANSLTRFKA